MSIRIATKEESLHAAYMRGWRHGASVDSGSMLTLVTMADPCGGSISPAHVEFAVEERRGYDDGFKERQRVSREARARYGVKSR